MFVIIGSGNVRNIQKKNKKNSSNKISTCYTVLETISQFYCHFDNIR